jgi:hypothetical protein
LLPKAASYALKCLTRVETGGPLSGIVVLVSPELKEIYLVNVYKMTIVKKVTHGFGKSEGLRLKIKDNQMFLTGMKALKFLYCF